jgi:hypothetical protein
MPPQNDTNQNGYSHTQEGMKKRTKYSRCDITHMCSYPVFKLLCDSVHRSPVRRERMYRVCHLKRSRNYNSTYNLTCDINVIVWLDTSLTGCAVVNDSRTTAEDFYAKWCSRTNTRSTRECTLLAPAEILSNCRNQQPSNRMTPTWLLLGKLRKYFTR